jgi:hypothetical protein
MGKDSAVCLLRQNLLTLTSCSNRAHQKAGHGRITVSLARRRWRDRLTASQCVKACIDA